MGVGPFHSQQTEGKCQTLHGVGSHHAESSCFYICEVIDVRQEVLCGLLSFCCEWPVRPWKPHCSPFSPEHWAHETSVSLACNPLFCLTAAHTDITFFDMTSLWLVCFVETDSSVVQTTVQDLKDCGFDCWETSIGGPGVQQHSHLSVKEEVLEILNRYWTRGHFVFLFLLPQDLMYAQLMKRGTSHWVELDRDMKTI